MFQSNKTDVWKAHSQAVKDIALLDGNQLASAAFDGQIKIWNLTNGALLTTLEAHDKEINQLVFSKKLKLLASASSDSLIKIW